MGFDSTARRPRGYVTVVAPNGPTFEADTLQCVHHGGHFQVVRGSGTWRGFCQNCMGPTCGRPECNGCSGHFMKKIELFEAGKLGVLR